ncbi:hypothetical protein D0T84_17450 [Dysgonomonas sp. 521]|uniref:hypothetical protein n=1 Tax=Dysgonomonas sp. 521 TaxID=2302932 RepID=UPI0013D240FF|nr:hypothetical protein [Dysgonomonas sp. 521]NDV96685.1 hypothetical protein [Dysgonomonas sp. 521]
MLSKCQVPGSRIGKSFALSEGGFNTIAVGQATRARDQWGESATFWSTSKSKSITSGAGNAAWIRFLTNVSTTFVERMSTPRYNQYSVRCKKD